MRDELDELAISSEISIQARRVALAHRCPPAPQLPPCPMCRPSSSSSAQEALTAHALARTSLIAEERSLRFDAHKLASLSPDEVQAEQFVRDLRAEEHVSVWQKEDEKPELFVRRWQVTS